MPERWDERHGLDVAVALLENGGAVRTVAESLDFWPFRHEELLDDLTALGLRAQTTTYDRAVDRYLVVASRDG